MKIQFATNQLNKGKKIRRETWSERDMYIKLVDGKIILNTMCGTGVKNSFEKYDNYFSLDDLMAADWIIYRKNSKKQWGMELKNKINKSRQGIK